MLDDHIVMAQAMGFSPFKKPFEEQIMEWERTLSMVSEVLDEWITLQRSWMYLEPIFGQGLLHTTFSAPFTDLCTCCNHYLKLSCPLRCSSSAAWCSS